MQQKDNPQRKEIHHRRSVYSSNLEEKFAQYDNLIQKGYRFFGDYCNDDCNYEGNNDDDADCNYYNCC